ncbi:MAG: sugar ABC transporter permease [Rhodospirillaceae bacterium]|nr:sugar ABC transporter permease [Rhodospirillaceae bacterium]
MLVSLELRPKASKAMVYQSPLIAVFMTLITSMVMFWLMDTDPFLAINAYFIEPVSTLDGVAELLVKATPLILIALGLSVGFQANIWNIGAEGQLTLGAIFSGGIALAYFDVDTPFLLPAMLVFGVLGGMFWAAIPAILKVRYNTNEILTSLMLTYVGLLLLSYLIHGPLRDPDGFNFPESRLFHDSALLPIIIEGSRLHIGFLLTLFIAVLTWMLLIKHIIGFQIRVIGMAPAAARFAGFKQKKLIWITLLFSGGAAGLAGAFEVSGPIGQIVPVISPGYGFTAIIVAFLGRLHPLGVVLAGILMALTYLGGDAAQITMNLPNAVTGVFQGMLLFFLLASDVLIRYRFKIGSIKKETT